MIDERIVELIHRRRRQMLVHSILYYEMNVNTIPDYVFDAWAHELGGLQKTYPNESAAVDYMRDEFKDWTGDGGSHLPLTEPRATAIAKQLKERQNA
jgi:hypothetical protein